MKDALISDLFNLADSTIATHSTQFMKSTEGGYGEGDQFLGIRVPELRKIARKYKKMSHAHLAELLKNFYHEIRLTALFILVIQVKSMKEIESIAQLYLKNLQGINNWDLVDSSAPYILGPYLNNKDRSLLYTFAESDNLWQRRISIITCFHFIRNNDFSDALSICEILLNDSHDLIHKATGWMLREIGNRDQNTEMDFLAKHYRQMPRTMLRYAIEKFEEPLRQKYLKGLI